MLPVLLNGSLGPSRLSGRNPSWLLGSGGGNGTAVHPRRRSRRTVDYSTMTETLLDHEVGHVHVELMAEPNAGDAIDIQPGLR